MLSLAKISHQTSQSVPVSCARVSLSHYILCRLARMIFLKSELFTSSATSQPCLGAVWTALVLRHSHV